MLIAPRRRYPGSSRARRLLSSALVALACVTASGVHDGLAAERRDPFRTEALRPAKPSQFWAGGGVPCAAQPAVPDPLHLADAIDLALCHNPQTRQSWASAKVQAAEVGVARSAYLPDIGANLSLQRSEIRNSPAEGGFTDLDASLSIDYLLFDFGGRAANLALARESLLAANWTHNNTLQQVMLDATQGYYQLFATQEAVQSTLAAEKASLASLEAARARLKAGTATRADVLQAQTAYSQARLDRTQAEGDAAAARGILANALGLPADRELRIAPPPDLEAQQVAERAVSELIEAAQRLRPDLAAAQAQVRAAESNISVQQSLTRPSISAFGTFGASQSSPGSDPRSGAVGLQLNIPLFTGYRNTYRVYQAREQLETQTASRDRLASDITLDVWRAYQDLRTQRQSLDTSNDLVASAQENYNVALARYKAGVGTITDLLNAQSALVSAELQRIRARYQWNLAKATLAKAIGVLQPDLIGRQASPTYTR
jgi:TolC family type I secretion outer membrane protein